MKSVSPTIASPGFGPKVTTGYLGDLAATGRILLTRSDLKVTGVE
jgi:hypothetical protein